MHKLKNRFETKPTFVVQGMFLTLLTLACSGHKQEMKMPAVVGFLSLLAPDPVSSVGPVIPVTRELTCRPGGDWRQHELVQCGSGVCQPWGDLMTPKLVCAQIRAAIEDCNAARGNGGVFKIVGSCYPNGKVPTDGPVHRIDAENKEHPLPKGVRRRLCQGSGEPEPEDASTSDCTYGSAKPTEVPGARNSSFSPDSQNNFADGEPGDVGLNSKNGTSIEAANPLAADPVADKDEKKSSHGQTSVPSRASSVHGGGVLDVLRRCIFGPPA